MSLRLSEMVLQVLADDPVIAGVTADSRKVAPGFLFAALPGSQADGRAFIQAALDRGAAAILAPDDVQGLPVPVVHAADLRRAYALAAMRFHGRQPPVSVAITGTNGKTSIAAFCRQIFASLGRRSASMGTLGVVISLPGQPDLAVTPPGLTTPDAADVAALMARMVDEGVTHLALEASSHGIDQRRIDGVRLTAAGFTNFTQDHLDYHGSMEAYRSAKLRLFEDLLPSGSTAVLNADSNGFEAFAAAATAHGHSILSTGEAGQGIRLVQRQLTPAGQDLTLRHQGLTRQVRLPLAGAFQADNALVAAGLCIAAGEAPGPVFSALESLVGAPGRMQRVEAPEGEDEQQGEVYVDYAHTPDGLETLLRALRPHARGRLIVVFGAGGDRDAGKRPMMGAIATSLADVAIVTDDNPRSEAPAAIREAILAAAPDAHEIGDRRMAIRAGVAMMKPGDVLAIAGKGHEQGQMIAGVNHPFDDVAEARAALAAGAAHD
jgi:UDP-N-acetylmuramoyl-L-alanyl-D-glutamate--2,6-diaminopimelate ligase